MTAKKEGQRLGSILAENSGRSLSIGIWFVLSLGAIYCVTQTAFGFPIPYAALAALLGATVVASARTSLLKREQSTNNDEAQLPSVSSDLIEVLREHNQLLRKQQETSSTQLKALATLDESLTARLDQLSASVWNQGAWLSTSNSTNQELIVGIGRMQAVMQESREVSGRFTQHLIRIFDEGQQSQQKILEQLTSLLASVIQHRDRAAFAHVLEEKPGFAVILTATGPNKINVIKAVREVTSLGLKEAKDLVDSVPRTIKSGLDAEEAAAIRKKFLSVGASAEVKPPRM